MTTPPHIDERMILGLLAVKHAKDVLVSECKDGPTWFTGSMRMDAWAMKRSWAHPLVTVYEIKTCRRDFLADGKWRAYLDCCNEFYFVCPPAVVREAELPQDVGLYWTSASGTRLLLKRKAPRRDVTIPEELWRYVLMCRAKIVGPRQNQGEEPRAFWRRWLAEKGDLQDVGHRVSRALASQIRERITKVETENSDLKRENDRLADIKPILERLGLTATWFARQDIERAAVTARLRADPKLVATMERAQAALGEILAHIRAPDLPDGWRAGKNPEDWQPVPHLPAGRQAGAAQACPTAGGRG